jgi:SAM-dependent methyltransferase
MDLVEARLGRFDAPVRHPWESARVALAYRLLRRHVDLKSGDSVLDVGCGDTFVCEELARRYPAVQFYAVDTAFTDDVIATLRARLTVPNVSLFQSLDAVPAATPAALVLLMDVVEHVPDDAAFLADICRRRFVDGHTQFLITVPSFQSLFCSHDRFLGHYRRYTVRTLGQLLTRAKLASIDGGYLFATLLPVRVLQVLRERFAGPAEAFTGLSGWHGGEARTRMVTALLTLDGMLSLFFARVGIRIPGLSSFAICRKSA